MLTQMREDGMIHCAIDTTEKSTRTSTKGKTESKRDVCAKVKTEDVLITPPVDPPPDLCVQDKTEQEELKGKLGKHIFYNSKHITCIFIPRW